MEIKQQLLKILDECKKEGYDDLHFDSDREYIANILLKSGLIKEQDNDW